MIPNFLNKKGENPLTPPTLPAQLPLEKQQDDILFFCSKIIEKSFFPLNLLLFLFLLKNSRSSKSSPKYRDKSKDSRKKKSFQ